MASEHLAQVTNTGEVVNATFDEALDALLPGFHVGIHLVFIDGHHAHDPTLRYLERIQSRLDPGALVVFDDIRLTAGLWRAWCDIRGRRGFAHTIDTGRFGMALWSGGATPPVRYDLAWYLGDFFLPRAE